MLDDATPRKAPRRLFTRRDIVLSLLFVYLWLLPLIYTSVTDTSMPLVPKYLKHLHAISCLFNNRVEYWSNQYFEVLPLGSNAWLAPGDEDYFRLEPFGYRNRMHQMFRHPDWHGLSQMQALAEFIKQRYEELDADGPPLVAVRFVMVPYKTGEEVMTHPAGRWRKPPLEQVEDWRRKVHSIHFFDGRPPRRGS